MLIKKKCYEEITIKAAFGLVSKIIKNNFFRRVRVLKKWPKIIIFPFGFSTNNYQKFSEKNYDDF